MSDSKAKPEGAEDAVAVNGVVDGRRIWIEEEPWFLFDGAFPVRFEDGALDWRRLSESEREEVVRVDAHMRGLYGIADRSRARRPVRPGLVHADFHAQSPDGQTGARV